MKFVKTTPEAVHELIAQQLLQLLKAHDRVVWLIPGGSNIPVATRIMQAIPSALQPKLAMTLTDERYGEVGHVDSNVAQLAAAGFASGAATFVPVLAPGLSLEQTVKRFAEILETLFAEADVVFAQFGMGADGHIAGALPGSIAVENEELTAGYDAGTFKRVTMTPAAIKRLDHAVLAAFGEEKLPMLKNLRNQDLPLAEQPAQVLKSLGDVTVYNDQLEG